MYCIVDIETTGGSNKSGRITEIAAFLHDGAKCVDKFVSLVNPHQPIPPFVVNLTGISNEMVAEAPDFEALAEPLFRFMANSIFVGHNVNFDYGFLREEFRRVGMEFRRKKLCTVQLSRNTFPGLPSYSLGKITRELDISHEDAHRAESDAFATMLLFERIVAKQSIHGLFDTNFGANNLSFEHSDLINRTVIESIPDECGVFCVIDRADKIIFAKRSSELVNTIYDKFRAAETQTDRNFLERAYRIDFQLTGSPLLAQLIEAYHVVETDPKFNQGRFSMKSQFGIFTDDPEGKSFHLRKYKLGESPVVAFTNFFEGLDFLKSQSEGMDLRLVETFRKRWKTEFALMDKFSEETYPLASLLPRDSYLLIDEGVDVEHRTLIYVIEGVVKGYSQARKDDAIDISDLDGIEFTFAPYAELDLVVRQFLAKGKFEKRVELSI